MMATSGKSVLRNAFCVVMAAFTGITCAETITLTPAQAVDLALKNNKLFKAGEWTVKEKEEAKKQAYTGFLPKVSANASYRRTSDVPSFSFGDESAGAPGGIDYSSLALPDWSVIQGNPGILDTILGYKIMEAFQGMSQGVDMGSKDNYSLGLNLTQPIFTGFKVINGYRAAEAGQKAQELDQEKARQLMGYSALSMYWMLYTMEKGVGVAEDAKAQLAKLEEDQQKMFEQKMLAEHDLFQIKASHSKLKVGVLQTRRLHKLMMRRFADFLNLKPDIQIILQPGEDQDVISESRELNDYLEWVKDNRPDLKQQEEVHKATVLGEKISKSGYIPNVVLTGNYTYAKPNQQVSFENEWGSSWSIILMATWNLWDWGASFRQGKQAEYRRRALEEVQESTERQAVTQAMDAYESVHEYKEEYDASKEAADAAELSYNAINLKYEAGMASTFELLTAQSSLTEARFTELNSKVTLKLALENMKIGGLGSSAPTGEGTGAAPGQGDMGAQQGGMMQGSGGMGGMQ
jgi:outer membrane protein TolC